MRNPWLQAFDVPSSVRVGARLSLSYVISSIPPSDVRGLRPVYARHRSETPPGFEQATPPIIHQKRSAGRVLGIVNDMETGSALRSNSACATPRAVSADTGKPGTAVQVTASCTSPGAAASGGVTAPPFPIPTVDGALYLAAEVIWGEAWPARHNHELWLTGPDGGYSGELSPNLLRRLRIGK